MFYIYIYKYTCIYTLYYMICCHHEMNFLNIFIIENFYTIYTYIYKHVYILLIRLDNYNNIIIINIIIVLYK